MYRMTILVGNLTRDPETTTVGETTITKTSVACTKSWRNADGDKKEETSFFDLECWGKRGEAFGKHHSKGDKVFVECEPKQSSWEDEDGNKRSRIVFVVNNFSFVKQRNDQPANEDGGDDDI